VQTDSSETDEVFGLQSGQVLLWNLLEKSMEASQDPMQEADAKDSSSSTICFLKEV